MTATSSSSTGPTPDPAPKPVLSSAERRQIGKSLARETTEWLVTEAPRVSLADIKAAIGFRYNTTAAGVLGEGLYANCIMHGPAGKPLWEMFICILVTWGGAVIVGKHAATDRELGPDLAYNNAIQQLWSQIGMAPKDSLDERCGVGRDGWTAKLWRETGGRILGLPDTWPGGADTSPAVTAAESIGENAAPIAPVINLIGPSDEALMRENQRLEREVRRLESLLTAEEAKRPIGAGSTR